MDRQFRQIIDINSSNFQIEYQHKTIFIGSCFADNVSRKMEDSLMDVLANPYGVAFNPATVWQSIQRIIENRAVDEKDFVWNNGLWNHMDMHSSFSSPEKQTSIENINSATTIANKYLQQADNIVITFGTAWVYRLKATGKIVANCHKLPTDTFERQLLTVDQIAEQWIEAIEKIKAFVPKANIIMTISPIRHIKDGAHGNQISKSTLLLAIDKIQAKQSHVYYFPSFEIMMDELRDYRFYNDDYNHPSNLAVDYIFERFTEATFSDKAKQYIAKGRKIVQEMNHRPNTSATKEYIEFKQNILEHINQLKRMYPMSNTGKKEQLITNEIDALKKKN